ncbi:MAG TPA: hypothetical protein VJB06_02260 [archaeon]|nr:hypothetical protein [archaeon]
MEEQKLLLEGKHETQWVTISLDEYESMKATLEILSDPKALKELKKGEKERLQGKGRNIDDVKQELGL